MTGKIKLLFVIENSSYGGGEKTFSLLIRGLDKEKFEVYCASLPTGRFYDETKDLCRFIPFDLTNRFNLSNIWRLKRVILENGIDLIHSQGARADFYSGLAASAAGTRAVATVAMPVEGFEIGFFKKALYLALNALSEKYFYSFITVAEFLKEFLIQKHGLSPDRVEVIANPAVLDGGPGFDAARVIDELKLRGRLVLAALGRLEAQKGFDILLQALALVARDEPVVFGKLKCVIAGAGSSEDSLRRMAARLGLGDTVIFPGFRTDIRDLLAAADIFVMPSRAEGQPLVLLEAMAAGKPIIASDLPGVKEIVVDGVNGTMFKAGDAGSLAFAIIGLTTDPARSGCLALRAAQTASGFTLEKFLNRHEDFYLNKAVCHDKITSL